MKPFDIFLFRPKIFISIFEPLAGREIAPGLTGRTLPYMAPTAAGGDLTSDCLDPIFEAGPLLAWILVPVTRFL